MGTLGPPLHQGVKHLIVGTSLLTKERENKALESGVVDLNSDKIRERAIPSPSAAKIPSSFKGVGIELRGKEGKCFLALCTYLYCVFSLMCQLNVESSITSEFYIEKKAAPHGLALQ